MAYRSHTAIALSALLSLACGRSQPPPPAPADEPPREPIQLATARGNGAGDARARTLPSSIRVLVGGDLLPHRPTLASPDGILDALAPLRGLFLEADRVVLNYEGAILPSDSKALSDPLVMGVAPAWVASVGRAGVSALTFANNHACDGGERGLLRGLSVASERGILAIGADADDAWEGRVLSDKGGHKVCAVSWTTQMNNKHPSCANSPLVAHASLTRIGDRRAAGYITRAKNEGCDAIVAIVHGGDEYVAQIAEMSRMGRRAADAGADVVVMHHPHVASPVHVVGTRDGRTVPVFASVGNLVSNQGARWKVGDFPRDMSDRRHVARNAWTRLGVLADLTFRFGPSGKRVEWATRLTWTENEHADQPSKDTPRIQVRLIDPKRDEALLGALRADDEGPLSLFTDPCWQDHSGHPCVAAPAERRSAHPREVARVARAE